MIVIACEVPWAIVPSEMPVTVGTAATMTALGSVALEPSGSGLVIVRACEPIELTPSVMLMSMLSSVGETTRTARVWTAGPKLTFSGVRFGRKLVPKTCRLSENLALADASAGPHRQRSR